MTSKDDRPEQAAHSPENLGGADPEETRQMLHELRVHEIELEMQNEELRRAPVGYFTLSEQGLILEANLTAANLLGIARDALVNKPLPRFILPEDQDIFYLSHKQLFKTVAPQVWEMRILKKDGTTFWARMEGIAAKDANGVTICRIVLSNITESKQTEEALRESGDKLAKSYESLTSILDSLDSLVYVAEFDSYEILFINKYGRDIFGDVQGRKCWQAIQNDQKGPCSFCTNDRLLSDSGIPIGVYQWEFQNTTNGRWYECRDQAIAWIGKTLVRMEIATDITDRKQTEAALWESRQRFQGLVETLYDWIWEVDPQGHYTYISPRIKDILGYEPEELLGKTPFEMMPTEEVQRVLEIFGSLMAEQKPIISMENINLHKDGHPVVMETSGLPFYDSKGNFKGYRGT